MPKFVPKHVKDSIRQKYAWPGGYPMFLVLCDGEALCMDCAKKEWRNIVWDHIHEANTGWKVDGVEVNWEDHELYCGHCSNLIESAY